MVVAEFGKRMYKNTFMIDDEKFSITIKKVRHIRSVSQNRLYWMWLHVIAEETGHETDYLHQYFREKHLTVKHMGQVFDGIVTIVSSTTELDTKQFTDYLDKINRQMGDIQIWLPYPEDQGFTGMVERYGE